MKWPIPINKKVPLIYAASVYSFLENKGEKARDSFFNDLGSIVDILINKDPDINKLFCSPLISKKEKFNLIEEIFGNSIDSNVFVFLRVLIERGRLDHLEDIYKAVIDIHDHRSGFIKGDVHIASRLDKKRQDDMLNSLSEITGKKVKINFVQDTSLIAGFNTLIGSYFIDYSLKGQLEHLEVELKRS